MNILFSLFRAARDNEPILHQTTWSQFVAELEGHDTSIERKADAPAFSPAEYQPGAKRAAKNVLRVHFGVLDVDEATDDAVERLADLLSPYAHVLYTTWGHAAARPRWKLRVVLPFSRPVEADEWRAFWPRLNAQFDSLGDTQCKDISRLYFAPACPETELKEALFHAQEGPPLDVDEVLASTVTIETQLPADPSPRVEVVHVDELKILARRLKQRQSAYHRRIGRMLATVLRGDPFAEEGERDTSIFQLAGMLAETFPQANAEALAAHFAASLQLMGDFTPEDVAAKITRHQDALESAVQAAEEAAQTEKRTRIQEALGGDRIHPYTSADLEAMAHAQQCTVDGLRSRWLVQRGTSYYLLMRDNYVGPFIKDDVTNAALRDFAPASSQVELWTESKDGLKLKSLPRLVREYGSVADKVVVSMLEPVSRYEPESRTFYEATAKRRDIEPRQCQEVERWLELLAGSVHGKVLDWIAVATQLEHPCAALYLDGAPGTGKTLLADGLSRVWTTGGPAELERAMAENFNSAFMACPLVLGDECVPRDYRGRVRTQELRQFIQARTRTLRRKYRPDSELVGCARLILTANNDTLLASEEQLTVNDIQALTERLIYVKCRKDAQQYLQSLGPSKVRDFVRQDLIAQHALWLAENRKVQYGGRFYVQGDDSELRTSLTTSSGRNSSVCNWCVLYLLNPSKLDAMGDGLVRIHDGSLYATSRGISQRWDLYPTNTPAPTATKVRGALRALGTGRTEEFDGGVFFQLRSDYLIAWAESNGYASRSRLERALAE